MADELAESAAAGLVGLLHGKGGGLALPKPFEREIFLFDTHVAGTTHIVGIEELEPFLKAGDKLDFFREPTNAHDERAIVIKTANGVKIGYVPRRDNVVFSRLMDAGKRLFGRITAKEWQDEWLRIEIKIYLQE